MATRNFHEDLARHGDEPRASERNLGVTSAVMLALIAALKFYRGDGAAERLAVCYCSPDASAGIGVQSVPLPTI